VGGDPLDEIMGYLGLGRQPPQPPVRSAQDVPADGLNRRLSDDGDTLLAASGAATLWLTGNEDAEWIELRGPFTTFRATRPKAKLLVDVRRDLERWAGGHSPEVKARDLSICCARRFGTLVLEVTYRSWKPVRLTRDQARVLLRMIDHVREFATGSRS
jgi:hypothetical protein